ncbi:MAG: murein biosynthesis integral membrane protein MurJ [Holosporaceae bacterium]|nr:murein biosynthesis integral membrane protein MurJ [Holosporaceae bacterium]
MDLVKNVVTVGGWTLVYRVSSFIRDIAQSYTLGAGLFADVASLSFKFANSLRKLFAEGAFNASFLPVFSNSLKEKGRDEAQRIASQIFTWLTILVAFLSIVGLIFFRNIMRGFAPGIDPSCEKFEHLVAVGRICSPYVAASFLSAMFGGILNTLNRFAMPAAAQLTLNIFVIIALFSGPLFFPSCAYTMACGVFLSGVVQVIILWINVKHCGFNIGLNFASVGNEVKMFFKRLLSGIIGAGVLQLNILIDFGVLSFLPTGAVSYFYYVDHVNQFPLGILGIAFSTALLPPITRAIHAKKISVAQKQMNLGLLFAFIFTFPASVLLMSLSEPLIASIYGRGNFTGEHVSAAYPALIAFSFGLPVYMATKVFSSAFFANKDTQTPLKGGLLAIFFNLLFIGLLVPSLKHTGIAMATTLSSWCNWIYLAMNVKKRCGIQVNSSTKKTCRKLILVSLGMLTAITFLNTYAERYYQNGGVGRAAALLIVTGFGLGIFGVLGAVVRAFGFLKEIKEIEKKDDTMA